MKVVYNNDGTPYLCLLFGYGEGVLAETELQ